MLNVRQQAFIFVMLLLNLFASSCNSQTKGVTIEAQSTQDVEQNLVKKLSVGQLMKDNLHLPIPERISLFHRTKKESPEKYNFDDEGDLNLHGYYLLWNDFIDDAVAIFALNVAQFPDSPNTYDSLGEAYMAQGNMEKSLVNYEKALAMNPENFFAEDQIEKIKFPDRKQLSPAEKFVKVYTPDEYKDDLDQMGRKLLEVHPNALKFITEAHYWKTIEEKKALITDKTTYAEFVWHCNEIIANLNCSHSSLGRFWFENSMLPLSLRFPLQTRWVDNKLYVIDTINNGDKVKIKDEILSINGLNVADLVRDIYKHIPSQGYIETMKRHEFNALSTGLIAYALGFPKIYHVEIKGKTKSISLNPAKKYYNQFNDPSIETCKNQLCFEQLSDSKSAVLTISSFNYYEWDKFDVFKAYMDSTFQVIDKQGIENLVIDLRFNGGGSAESSIYLLRYLVDQPFSYHIKAEFEGKKEKLESENVQQPFANGYRGKLYFIIDGNGNSATGHFMSVVKFMKLGIVVGEELGSNHFCSAGQTICRTTNTKTEYSVANNTHIAISDPLPAEVGILPDHFINQNIEDYLHKVDAV